MKIIPGTRSSLSAYCFYYKRTWATWSRA